MADDITEAATPGTQHPRAPRRLGHQIGDVRQRRGGLERDHVSVVGDGYLVAVETTGLGGGKDMQIEVTNVNDPANKVDEPS